MLRLARRTSLLVAFHLLASAATAYAASSWVVWVVRGEGKVHIPMFTHATVESCNAAVKRLGDKADNREYYLCLPDSIDPRESKVGSACGWVVWAWVKPLPSARTFWSITTDAFETKGECEAHARQRWNESKNKADRKYDEQFHCFPGSTDPRQKEDTR